MWFENFLLACIDETKINYIIVPEGIYNTYILHDFLNYFYYLLN